MSSPPELLSRYAINERTRPHPPGLVHGNCLTRSSVFPASPASAVLALLQSASQEAASLAIFLEEAAIRLSGAQRWFRLHLQGNAPRTSLALRLLLENKISGDFAGGI